MGLAVISICILLIVTDFKLLFICLTVKSELSSYPWFIFYSIDSFFFIDQRTFLCRLEKLVLFTVMSCINFVVCLPLTSCLFVDFFLDFYLLFSIFVVGFIVLHIWHFPLQDYLEKKKDLWNNEFLYFYDLFFYLIFDPSGVCLVIKLRQIFNTFIPLDHESADFFING